MNPIHAGLRAVRQQLTAQYFHFKIFAATLSALALLGLQGCAVNKQGNNTQFGLDPGELTAQVVQELQTAAGRGVLRRLPNGQYQIKLYDRNRVIDLGQMNAPFVDYIARVNEYDLISVGERTPNCGNTHRLVQVKGYDVYTWDFNNTPGRCSLPLEFVLEGGSWKITQQVVNADRQTWTWTAGRLATNYERYTPNANMANQRPLPGNAPAPNATSTSNNGRYATPGAPGTAPADKKNPFEGAGFEANDGDAQRRARANASTDKKKGEFSSAAPVVESLADSAPAARTPKPGLVRISEGNYSKPSAGSETEVAPIRVQLKN
jgi:hypothetical protein